MIATLIRWSLERRFLVLAISFLLLALGVWSAARMPVDVFPDLTAPTVTVLVEGEGLSPEEMERLVTFPIESAVNGANDVRRVRSTSAMGIAVVWVEFEWGTEVHRARQTVSERLVSVASALPDNVRAPKLAPQASILGEILFVALTSERDEPLELRRVANTLVRRRLLAEPGVAQVVPIGGAERQYQVLLEPALLVAHGVHADEVAEALADANQNISAGVIVRGAEESILQGVGRIQSVEDIENTFVAARGGRGVRVADLGSVRFGAAFSRGTAAAARRAAQGQPILEPAVLFGITKQPGVNTLELTRRLDQALVEIQRALPPGMTLNANLFRQSNFIETAVRNTLTALVEGGLMVVLVVVLFLASARASFITLLAIPMSLAVAVLALRALGGDINTMTLGGMAIAIGALVDDAIIDVENVARRLRENAARPAEQRKGALEVVFDASVEVRASIVFATVIILLVFSPIFALSGVEGRLLAPLGIAFCVGLAASLLTALTLTPAMCLWLLPTSGAVSSGRDAPLVRWIKASYARPLDWSMRHPLLVALPALTLFVGSAVALSRAGRNFLPEFNEGSLVVGVTTAPGTALGASDALARRVEHALLEQPEIVALGRRTGRAEEDEHVLGVEASEIEVTLDMQAPLRNGGRLRTKDELLEALRADLALIPGLQATFGQPISHRIDHMLSGSRASVALKVFGPDLDTLRRLARDVESSMKTVSGVVDLSIEPQTDVPAVRVEFDRAALTRHAVSLRSARQALERASLGQPVTQVLVGSEAYDLVVRVGDGGPVSTERLADAFVESADGERIPLARVAALREDATANFIGRENAERRVIVQCNIAGRDVTSVVNDLRAAVERRVQFPHGYWVEYGGQFESAIETTRRLTLLGAFVIAAMAGLLVWVLGSVRDALLVLVNLPLALIGGVAGVWLSGNVLSVASMIGFITVFGVAARNGILLVSHVHHLREREGVLDAREAVRRGSLERVAPILMTALAAGLALVPLALRGQEPGNEILTPMAIVILCGLVSSTLLNMLVVPALLAWFGRARAASLAPLVAVAAAGCTSVDLKPDWRRAEAEVRTALPGAELHTPDAQPADLETWLGDGELTRDEAQRVVLAAHPRIAAALQSIGVAHADWVQSGLVSNPALSAFLLFPAGGGRVELQASLAQSITSLWMIEPRSAVARSELDQSFIEAAQLAAELCWSVGEAHDRALAAEQLVLLSAERGATAERAASAAVKRAELGAGRALDVDLAHIELSLAELAQEQAKLTWSDARSQFLRALGVPLGARAITVAGELRVLGERPLEADALVLRALAARLDLRAARQAAESAALALPLERRLAKPKLELALQHERPTEGARLSGAGAVLTLPIFDDGSAAVARAEFEYEARRASWLASCAEAELDLRAALLRLAGAERTLRLADDELVQQARACSERAAAALARGDVSLATVLEADRALLATRTAHAEARMTLARALSDLERSAGAPLETLFGSSAPVQDP